jgi:hypothetical protein
LIIPAPKGRYPPADIYRLINEDQLVTNIPHPVQRALELLEHPVQKLPRSAAPRDTGKPAPRWITILVAEVTGAFRELR